MYLTSIEIKNFRSFQGYHKFDFKFQDKSNLNVIYGKNGVGKSIFVDAIYWCLYGKEFLNFSTQPLYNYASFNELDIDGVLSVIVDCKFESNGEIFEVVRELSFTKNSYHKAVIINQNPNLNIYIHSNDGNVEHREMFFDKFPEFLFNFLFYDDENPDFFEEGCDVFLKKTIGEFSMFDYINSTNLHINSLFEYYIKKLKKIAPKENLAVILHQNEEILNEIAERKKEIEHVHREKLKLMENQWEINSEISNYSKELGDLNNRRSRLSDELDRLSNDINDIEIKRNHFLFKSFPKAVMFSKIGGITEFEMLLNNPNLANSNFSQRYTRIKQFYDNFEVSDTIRYQHDLTNNLYKKRKIKFQELDEINCFFKYHETDEISNLEAMKRDIEKSIKMSDEKSYTLKCKMESLNKRLQHNETLRNRFDESQFSNHIINRKINFCKEALELGQQLEKELLRNIISKIDGYCNNIFFYHFGMDKKFRKIILNDSFDIQIVNHSNQTLSIGDLSSTEKKLLRFSLIFSIYQSLGLKFPIILMDPFSKLDVDKIEGLFNFIFEEFDNQIIFILNNNQYSDYIKHKFLENNVVTYQLIENYSDTEVILHER